MVTSAGAIGQAAMVDDRSGDCNMVRPTRITTGVIHDRHGDFGRATWNNPA
jgi:hypothetical protein